jgi:hypothetical protein
LPWSRTDPGDQQIPDADPDGDPDDQFDDATQSLAQREAEAHDGSDRREERNTVADDMNGDQPGESGRQCGLGDRQSSASPAPQSVLELRAERNRVSGSVSTPVRRSGDRRGFGPCLANEFPREESELFARESQVARRSRSCRNLPSLGDACGLEQRFRGLEVGCGEPLGEAGVNRGQEVTRRCGPSLLLP